jgi:glycosyltransferase involved in cell wall biosynthesis
MEFLARKNPEFNFIYIGRTEIDLSTLKTLKNIYFTGPVPYDSLPEWAAYFDAAIIPFMVNGLTISSNPIKLLEYFALGLPVVSTRIPEVEKFKPFVYIGDGYQEFSDLINLALKNNTASSRKMLTEIANKYSWESVTEKLSQEIIKSDDK